MERVIDFYAGSGALAFEALSRGATNALLYEKDSLALKCIEKNREALRIPTSQLRVLSEARPEEWVRSVEAHARDWGSFDTIFCDPPYAKGLVERALRKVLASDALSPHALVYVELGRDEPTPTFEGWVCEQRRDRGASAQCFYRRA